ncbi:sensor domain-containing diguanylate cyclase [Marinobacterium weihaiense]|uniref:diguanylate cyclase n=1 Tax=Marinobacterium weihaiense TaxID=2851016 RepID=A0ABS6MAY5_9GAMM|nr:diguanylate cyclase [Marinobacterium weihaiense]MBV0933453.1 diguanylate cyclase [Marinobacterium weihaiense]
MRRISYILVLVGLYAGVALFLHHIRQDKEQQYLDHAATLLSTTYTASLERYALAMDTFHSSMSQQPGLMALLNAGLNERPPNAFMRDQIHARLLPRYRYLQSRGIEQWQLHRRDGSSYLRFHAPGTHDDDLLPVRPSLRQLHENPRPSYGFEVGRLFIGFRFIYPLIEQGELVGSMETGVSFDHIRRTLDDLAPGQVFMFLLHRETVESIGFDHLRDHLSASQLSHNFLIDHLHQASPEQQGLPLPALLEQLASYPLDTRFKQGQPFSLPLYHQSLGYSAAFMPVYSFDQHLSGYILALHPEPPLTGIQWEYYTGLVISLVVILLLGWLVLSLHHQRQRFWSQQQRLDAIGRAVGEGIYVTDLNGHTLFVNEAACRMTGYNADRLYASNLHTLLHIHSPSTTAAPCPMLQAARTGTAYEGDELFRTRTGQELPVVVTSLPLIEQDEITGTVSVFRDISERKENERKLEELATTDPLTGLPNRRAFLQYLQEEIRLSKRLGHESALMMVDFDHFKAINDRYGHQAGDDVLQHFAREATACLRETDRLGRLGGEEFAILLPGTDPQGAHHLAERVRQRLEQHPTHSGQTQIPMTLSIGLTPLQAQDEDASTALNRADKALYRAKSTGRNRVEIG